MNLLKNLFKRSAIKRKIDEELRFHVDQRTAENIAGGMTAEEADREARKRFGNMQAFREECRDRSGASFGEGTARDIRFGLRILRKNPGFTSVAVLTLAVCIGANLSIFAVVDAILLRPLPFPNANRLVTLYNSYPKAGVARDGSSLPNYYERRGNIDAFSRISLFHSGTAIVGDAGSTQDEDVLRVSPEFFTTLGVGPVLGRGFTEDETTYQTDGVVILTDSYWREQFSADPNILGKKIRVDGHPRLIVGVLPPGFRFLSCKARLYFPLSSGPADRDVSMRHSGNGYEMIARLRPGVDLAAAQSQIDVHNAEHAAEYPNPKMIADAGFRTIVTPLHADHVKAIHSTLILIQTGGLFLLLLGGFNLVNLLLIRGSARCRELAIRQSLGANWQHVVRQVMTETVMLTILGGVVGLVIGAAGIRALSALGVRQLPLGAQIALDGRSALVAMAGAIVTGIVMAIPIAWFNLRRQPSNALHSESRGSTSGNVVQRLRHSLVIAQTALAFVLLSGATLLGLSLKHAMAVPTGFREDHILTGQITLPWASYPDWSVRQAFIDRLVTEARRQPGVSASGVIDNVPFSGRDGKTAIIVKSYVLKPGESLRGHYCYGVGGDAFAALGIPLRQGRFLTTTDFDSLVCVVDEDFARHYWPNGGAVGGRLFRGADAGPDAQAFTVVGVVGAVKQVEKTENQAVGAVYFPYKRGNNDNLFAVVRTSQQPESFALSLQQIVRSIDPDIPVNDIRSMEVRIEDSLVARRSPAILAGVFAGVALLLAVIGVYGVLAYAVAQRRREIGVRMALGALPGQIRTQFLAAGLRLLAAGTILGLIGAWMAGRAMKSVLYGVPAIPVAAMAGTTVVLTLVTLFACWLPARRAAKVDPMEALRHE